MHLSLKISVILSLLLTLTSTQEYLLFKYGKVYYKSYMFHERKISNVSLKDVKFIDRHLIPNAVFIKIVAHIPNLYRGSVRNLADLKNLSMPKCGIQALAPQAFQNLPKLRILHLQDNFIRKIDNNVFNYLTVQEVYLQRNKISTIHAEAFDNMPNLFKIHLNNNILKQWDSNWFKNTPKLTLLHFKRNKIAEIPENAFANIKTSHKINDTELVDVIIYLSNNRISFINPQAFQGIDALYELWIDRNNLTSIDKDTFSNIKELNKLYLQKNQIREVDKNAFINLDEMSVLNLASNDLMCLPYEVVSRVSIVKVENNNMLCNCLSNLDDKLKENGLLNKIKDGDECLEE